MEAEEKRTFKTNDGRTVILTEDEFKVLKTLKRLEKMNFGNLELFASHGIGIRYGGQGYQNEIYSIIIPASGGDGGDVF